MDDNLEDIGIGIGTNLVKETSCEEMAEMFKNISLDDLLDMPDINLPKIDLSKINLDIDLKIKMDEMFKKVTITMPDLEIPSIPFDALFDWLASKLGLPNIKDISMPKVDIPNPLDKLGENAKELLQNFTKCEKFKQNIINPGLNVMSQNIKK